MTGKRIRTILTAVVAVCGAAMFAAVAATKMLPATWLAALGIGLALLAGLIALIVRGGRKLRLCAGMLLAAPYIFLTVSGFTLANRTARVLHDAVVNISPTMPPAATAEPAPEPEAAPEAEPAAEPEAEPEAEPASQFPETFTVYVSGIDSRHGLVDLCYSDVNMVFTVNRTTHQILVVTTPRDGFLCVPGQGETRDKLTHIGNFGGIDMLMETMESQYGDIDYWFRIGFTGFEDVVDALGGVTVDSDYTFTSWEFDFADQVYTFPQGENTLNGDQALVFARERKSFPDGDIQRGRDQMKLVKGMVEKVLSPDLLANWSGILDGLEGEYETTVPYDLLAELVRDQLAYGGDWNVVCYTLVHSVEGHQVTYSLPDSGPQFVFWLSDDDIAFAKDMMARVRAGEIIEQPDIYS